MVANPLINDGDPLRPRRTRVDVILERSSSTVTKYFGLTILEDTIRYRWKTLPPGECH